MLAGMLNAEPCPAARPLIGPAQRHAAASDHMIDVNPCGLLSTEAAYVAGREATAMRS
jgi:hypothetical protein